MKVEVLALVYGHGSGVIGPQMVGVDLHCCIKSICSCISYTNANSSCFVVI